MSEFGLRLAFILRNYLVERCRGCKGRKGEKTYSCIQLFKAIDITPTALKNKASSCTVQNWHWSVHNLSQNNYNNIWKIR